MRRSWFDALVGWADRLPGPRLAWFAIGTIVITVPMHLGTWADLPGSLDVRPDLVTGAAAIPILLWAAMALDDVARGALVRLRPALDADDAAVAAIATDLTRTPVDLSIAAAVVGSVAGVASVTQSPANWGVDLAAPGLRLWVALGTSVLTDVVLVGFLAHVVHQLRVVARLHRELVTVDLFHLGPLYAFSTLTARTGVFLIGMTTGLIAAFAVTIGGFIFTGPADLLLIVAIFGVAIACFLLPLLGLHDRIVDEKQAQLAKAQATLSAAVEGVRSRIAAGDLEGAAKVKDALLAADTSVAAITRISTWPWRTETLRGFVSAVLLPIGLFLVYELLRRALQ